MTHNWYYQHFQQKLNELYRLRASANKEQLLKIYDSISIIHSVIDEGQASLADLITLCDQKSEAYCEDEKFITLMIDLANEEIIKSKNRYYRIPHLQDEELINLVDKFFQDTVTPEMHSKILKVLKKGHNQIHFDRLMDSNLYGDTFYIPYYDEIHIRMKRHHKFSDIKILAHELGHAMQFLTNFNSNIYEENFAFCEVISTFFELLLCDYMKQFPKFKDAAENAELKWFNFCTQHCRLYLLENEMMLHWFEIRNQNPERHYALLQNLLRELEVNYDTILEGNLDKLFSLELHTYTPYAIGYILAIELFFVYRKDKELGLLLLEEYMKMDLRTSKEKYYENILAFGITPNKNLENYKKLILK